MRIRIGLAAVAAMVAVIALAPMDSRASESPLFTLPYGFGTCGDCVQQCGSGSHMLEEGDRHEGFDELPHNCEEGWCTEAHGMFCPTAPAPEAVASLRPEDVQRLWELLADSAVDVNGALSAFDGRVFYNASRQAIQAYGCANNIVLNVPLTESQIASLD